MLPYLVVLGSAKAAGQVAAPSGEGHVPEVVYRLHGSSARNSADWMHAGARPVVR